MPVTWAVPRVRWLKLLARTMVWLALTAAFAFTGTSVAAERVVLQLKWEHEFQFAGYYAALWQGYYRDAGIDVDIQPAFDESGRYHSSQQRLISGEADFAIGGADILSGRDAGHPLVILAPVFQKSPGALVTTGSQKLRSLRDLAGMRIAVSRADYIADEFRTLLGTRLTRHAAPVLVDEPLTIQTLLEGRADALLTYAVSARQDASQQGVEIQLLHNADAEQLFYGDTLYTHQRVIDRNPGLVSRFTEASLKGWRYAMEHREEMIAAISSLPRYSVKYSDPQEYNRLFATTADEFLFYPHVDIGLNNTQRWLDMHRLMKSAGLLQGEFPGPSLFFDPATQAPVAQLAWLKPAVIALSVVVIAVVLVLTLPVQMFLPALLAVVITLLTWGLEGYFLARYQENLRREVWSDLASVRLKLEAVINRNFAMLRGVVGLVSSDPELSQRNFSEFAGNLIDLEPLLINIAAAPELVIRYIYPEVDNEEALGLNYRSQESQLGMVELARDSRRMVVAGPLELVQGGRAIIGRAPVFVKAPQGGERFWGVISAPMDFDGLLDEVGMSAPNPEIKIALRHGSVSAAVQADAVFFGAASVFSTNPVTMPVSLGAVEWQIAAIPAAGWEQYPPVLKWIKLIGLLLAAAMAAGLYQAIRQFQERLQISGDLRRNEGILTRVGRLAEVGGWEIDIRHNREYVSDEVYHLHGLVPVAIASEDKQRWLNYYDDDNRQVVERSIARALDTGEAQHFELMVNGGEPDEAWLRHMIEPVLEGGQVVQLMGVVQDISAIRRADATIQQQASFDTVTGLPNRNLFGDRLQQALQVAERDQRQLAILFIDLDHFKDVNDSLGHGVGDALLAEMGRRFSSEVRSSDTIARLGGDEFTVLLDGAQGSHYFSMIAQNLLAAAQRPVMVGDHQVFTSASIGVTFYPEDGQDVEVLLQRADQAMYAAKNAGRNTVRFFTQTMQDEATRRHQLHMLLAKAMTDKALDVYYQPIIDTYQHKVVKCEALLRWTDPTLGQVSPAEFVPLAEDTGMIVELGEYVMLKACADINQLKSDVGCELSLAFNKSTREFVEESRGHISALDKLREQALFPNITVEITESLLLQESNDTVSQLRALRDAGVEIAIDDFGTGYSSLSYLRKFPVDILKIDRSFIHEIEKDLESRALVRAIISMAHGLNIDVVAEGVETAGQFQILRDMKCRYVQGYYFSPALSLPEFKRYLLGFRSECA